MEVCESLHWDLHRGAWFWMHSSCNPNPWSLLIRYTPALGGPSEYKRVYWQRHQTEALYNQTIQQLLILPEKYQLPFLEEMCALQRQRLANLAEQSYIQMRFCCNTQLVQQWKMWIDELKNADEDLLQTASTAYEQDTLIKQRQHHKPKWRTRKKYFTSKPLTIFPQQI